MNYLIGILIIIFGGIFIIITHSKLSKGDWKYPETYSYKKTVLNFFVINVIYVLICLIIYICSKSLELSIGIWAFLFFYSLSGFFRMMLKEKHIKDRLKVEDFERNKKILNSTSKRK